MPLGYLKEKLQQGGGEEEEKTHLYPLFALFLTLSHSPLQVWHVWSLQQGKIVKIFLHVKPWRSVLEMSMVVKGIYLLSHYLLLSSPFPAPLNLHFVSFSFFPLLYTSPKTNHRWIPLVSSCHSCRHIININIHNYWPFCIILRYIAHHLMFLIFGLLSYLISSYHIFIIKKIIRITHTLAFHLQHSTTLPHPPHHLLSTTHHHRMRFDATHRLHHHHTIHNHL